MEDIAAVAARALTAEEAPNTDYVILGPELLSYGDVSGAPCVIVPSLCRTPSIVFRACRQPIFV